MSAPKLSVMTITYNHERYIEQAVRSALAQQTTFDYELVVGEDRSTDRTREILLRLAQEHPGRVRLLLRERNLGATRNFADTHAACHGEYVAVLEGDDYWTDPTKLARQVSFLDAHPDYAFCFHRTQEVTPEGHRTGTFPRTKRTDFTFTDLFPNNFIPTCSVVLRRKLCPVLPDWHIGVLPGDWPMWMLCARHGPFHMLPDVMSAYRVHPGGIWSGRPASGRHEQMLHMLTVAAEHFGAPNKGLFDREVAEYHFRVGWSYAVEENWERGSEWHARLSELQRRGLIAGWKVLALRLRIRHPRLTRTLAALRRRVPAALA